MELIDLRKASFALDVIDPKNFESFVKSHWTAKEGNRFVPLGGVHDGGADGIIYPHDSRKDLPTYLQASIQKNFKTKIQDTDARLKETGKKYKGIIFCTNQKVSSVLDQESALSEKLGCIIQIIDHERLLYTVNDSDLTINAFNTFVLPILSTVVTAENPPNIIPENKFLPDVSLCVFLKHELVRNQGKSELLESVTDSLIFWALKDTDSKLQKFMTINEIEKKILEVVPTVRQFLFGVLDDRLTKLRETNVENMSIEYSRRNEHYYLTNETKMLILEQDIQDKLLIKDVINLFQRRIAEKLNESNENLELVETAAEICLETVHSLFVEHGLKFTLQLKDESSALESQTIEERLKEQLAKKPNLQSNYEQILRSCLHCLNEALFFCTGIEKLYFGHLSRTYVIMFLVQNEPKIVEYFKSMSSNFTLYIGTDIIIKCLSEIMLEKRNQIISNSLRMLKQKGSKLILTELVVKEVLSHILATHYEYKYQYEENNNHMKVDDVISIDRILIRAYFMTRFQSNEPKIKNMTWQKYLELFCMRPFINPEDSAQFEEFRAFLEKHLKLDYESEKDMTKNLENDQINDLANKIYFARDKKERKQEAEKILCRNSAITILRVYDKRVEINDRSTSPYGFKTWWLTDQSKLLTATIDLVEKMNGRYMIRLEFILNYLLSKPEFSSVIKSYQLVFPTILGIQLSKHINEDVYESIVDAMHNEHIFENEARRDIELGKLSNKLISDFRKEY